MGTSLPAWVRSAPPDYVRASLVTLVLLAAPAAGSQEAGPAAGAVVAADTSSFEVIASCIEESSGDEIGLAELEEACPGIEHALTRSGYVGFISESEIEQLTVHGLADLQHVTERYRRAPTDHSAQADVTRLAPILGSLQEEPQGDRPLTLLERFKRWLNSLRQQSQQEQDSWLSRWLRDFDVSESVTRAIVYVSIALILLIAIIVIVNELRAAGVFRRRERRRAATVAAAAGSVDLSRATLADLERVRAAERPALLLRILVNTLIDTGRLRTEKSLTHRELGTRAAFDAVDQRRIFNRVASLSERLLYGNRDVPSEEIDAVVAAGRTLDQQLGQPRAAT